VIDNNNEVHIKTPGQERPVTKYETSYMRVTQISCIIQPVPTTIFDTATVCVPTPVYETATETATETDTETDTETETATETEMATLTQVMQTCVTVFAAIPAPAPVCVQQCEEPIPAPAPVCMNVC